MRLLALVFLCLAVASTSAFRSNFFKHGGGRWFRPLNLCPNYRAGCLVNLLLENGCQECFNDVLHSVCQCVDEQLQVNWNSLLHHVLTCCYIIYIKWMSKVNHIFCFIQFCAASSRSVQWKEITKALRVYKRNVGKSWTDDCWNKFLEELCSCGAVNLAVSVISAESGIIRRYND